jgi:DNA-binding response OmpR family regulator
MVELAGLRALVVEDEGGVALLIEDMLEQLGCDIAASIATLEKALAFARANTFDFAVLDVNLDGKPVFPLAELLKSRKLPFVFSLEDLERKLRSALGKDDNPSPL